MRYEVFSSCIKLVNCSKEIKGKAFNSNEKDALDIRMNVLTVRVI